MTPVRRNTARLKRFVRRLGIQAAMSALVMTGLHVASTNGDDLRTWIFPEDGTGRPGDASAAQTQRTTGVPARFDFPVEAGGAVAGRPGRLTEERTPEVAAAAPRPAPPALPAADPAPVPPARIAVPSPRPATGAQRSPRRRDPAPAAAELSFDVSAREVPDLVRDDIPVPPEAGGGRAVGGVVPAGAAILRRTADLTGSAADAVAGTAARILGLVR